MAEEADDWERNMRSETEFNPLYGMYDDIYDDDLDLSGFYSSKVHDPDTKDYRFAPENSKFSAVEARLSEVEKSTGDKVERMRIHIEAEIQETSSDLTNMVRTIRQTERRLNSRIMSIANQLQVQIVDPLEHEEKSRSRTWMIPFFVFILSVMALAVLGYSRYRTVMKSHLL